jgi:hypothetical protein
MATAGKHCAKRSGPAIVFPVSLIRPDQGGLLRKMVDARRRVSEQRSLFHNVKVSMELEEQKSPDHPETPQPLTSRESGVGY